MRRYCPHCGSIHSGRCRSREPWRAAYHGASWERARQAAIGRQHGRCASCGRVCASWDGTRWATRELRGEVHHVIPLRDGGTDAPGNLVLLCARCHRAEDARRRKA